MMIAMENALQLFDLPPANETSKVAKTLAIVQFHRNYMQQVFAPDRKLTQRTGVDKYETIKFMSSVCDK